MMFLETIAYGVDFVSLEKPWYATLIVNDKIDRLIVQWKKYEAWAIENQLERIVPSWRNHGKVTFRGPLGECDIGFNLCKIKL